MTGYDLTGRTALVLGADADAAAEVGALVDAGATVTVAPAPHAGADVATCAIVDDLAARGLVRIATPDVDPATFDVVVRPRGRGDAPIRSGPGRVTLVGGGPGDPGLLTLAGRAAIETADVVVADRLAPLAALRWAPEHAEVIDVGKIPGGRSTGQDEINRLLVDHAKAGKHVVRFKGGDSFVFGRGGEEAVACAGAGVEVSVVPGVSSSIAGPALAGVPVTHRGLVQGFTVVSGHVPPGHESSTLDYAALARLGTTIVVLMGVRTLPAICAELARHGLDPATAVTVVADASLPSQVRVRGTLETIDERLRSADVGPPAIAVIGAVADIDGLP